MKVAKFGGTSLATGAQIKKVCSIIVSDPQRQLVVVSAPGKRFKNDIKVTDLLIKCARARISGESAQDEVNAVIERYKEIIDEIGLSENIFNQIRDDIKKRINYNSANKEQFIDVLKAAGEDNCARLLAEYLRSMGEEASYINPGDAGLILNNEYGNARVLPESFERLKLLKKIKGIKIFPGFFGYSSNGEIVTFSRGGSDITGSILAASVKADIYENFTDVDSVYAADPNIVSNPVAIKELTYREMRELSYAGFSILHEETLEPVYHMGIPVYIRNTNNPSGAGTKILLERKHVNGPVAGIASEKGFCSINVSKYMMNREVGFGRKILQILEDEMLSYEHMPSGIDNVSIILKEDSLTGEVENRITQRISKELEVDDISVERNLAVIVIVGEGMSHTIGVSARATTAFAKAGVNIEMINQGSSEVSMIFGIKAGDSEKAVRALYDEFMG